MKISSLMTAAAALLLSLALPAVAQTTLEQSGHHYQGGPKTEVPHHMGKKTTTGSAARTKMPMTSGHHYQGGPKTEVPHHMDEKPY